MSNGRKPPNLGKQIRIWVFRHFGIPGLVVLALFSLAVYAYMNWDTILKWPGVASAVTYISRCPIPTADPNRISVLVAHLENDTLYEHEQLIVEALKEFKGIQILRLDRNITLKGTVPEEEEKRGHESARNYLKQSGASVLIWGMVLKRGDKAVPKLYWTAIQGDELKPKRYNEPRIDSQFRLPEVFWSDLADILHLLVASYATEFRAENGRYVADRLPSFISRVRTLLEASNGQTGWTSETMGSTRLILADALYMLGTQNGKNEPLEEAITNYRKTFQECSREQFPLKWATTQNNLGNALQALGKRENSAERLEEAVDAYREALKERTRVLAPLQWASTQNSLGTVLHALSERENGTARIAEAMSAYREALKEITRERVPLKWATVQNNLGIVLGSLAEREGGTDRIKEAVSAFRESLKECTRERAPLDWAETQNNLGTALFLLGQRESGTDRLEEAISAFQEVLKEHTRERMPLKWATTQISLSIALSILGEREIGTDRLMEAVSANQEALKEFTRERVPYDWAKAQYNLGNTLKIIGEREIRTGFFEEVILGKCKSGTARLEGAVTAYREALKEFTRERAPLQWAGVQDNIARVLQLLEVASLSNLVPL